MAELWAGRAILFLQKAFHRDLTQLNPAFQNLKISLLELEQRNKVFYTWKYHFCNWGKCNIKIQINDELQNHTYGKKWKLLVEITHQRSLLASAQRLRGDGLQGLSFSPLSLKCLNQLISGDILWVIHDWGTAAWLPRVCVDLVQNQRWMGWVQQVKAIVHNLVQDLCLNFKKTKEEWGGSSSVQELPQE